MTTEITLWLVGQGIFLISGLIAAYFNLLGRLNDHHLILSNRLTKIETAFDLMGRNAAKVLHRDDDGFQIDALLDKYLDRHYELSTQEWRELKSKCQAVVDNPLNQPGYRSAAAMLAAICTHKLHLPPTDDLRIRFKRP